MREKLSFGRSKNKGFYRNMGISERRVNELIERAEDMRLFTLHPLNAIEKIWNSDMKDSEAAFLLWRIAALHSFTQREKLESMEDMIERLEKKMRGLASAEDGQEMPYAG